MIGPVDFEIPWLAVCMPVRCRFELPRSPVFQPVVPARVDTLAVSNEVDSVFFSQCVLTSSAVSIGSVTRHDLHLPAPRTRFIYQLPASYQRKPTVRYAPAGSEPWAWATVCRGSMDVDRWTTPRSHVVIASTLSKASLCSPASISGFRLPTHDLLKGTNLAVSRYESPSFRHSLTVHTATS